MTFTLNLCQREFYTTNLKLRPSFLTLSSLAEHPGEEFAVGAVPSWTKLVGRSDTQGPESPQSLCTVEKCSRKGLLELSNGVWAVPGFGERSEPVS